MMRRISNFSTACLSILGSLAVQSSAIAQIQTLTGTVVSVGDGDTLRVRTENKVLTIRVACVDAAEMSQKPYGEAASNRLKELLPVGQPVSIRVVVFGDQYGRTVAKVFKGDLSINVTLVQEGQAAVYREYLGGCPELRDRLLKAEADAKARRLGIWAQTNPVMPWDYRRAHSPRTRSAPPKSKTRSYAIPPLPPAVNSAPKKRL
jgi:micrococcal nuclease